MAVDIKKVVVEELHKPARKIYPRRKTVLKGIDDLWEIDLVEMLPYARENKGYRYLLTVIDAFSKYAWAIPIKRKTGDDVSRAMATVFKNSKRVPKNILSDFGKEFYNSKFRALMEKNKIRHYSTFSNMKAAICERFNRTLKSKMWKAFSLRGNYKYLDILPNLLQDYNKSFHRTIKMKPSDVNSKKAEQYLLTHVYLPKRNANLKPNLKEGDFVRVSKQKTMFSKGYTPNWSAEIFKITKVQNTVPYTYILEDLKKNPIKGSFYKEEIQKVKYPDVYLIEKIIKKKNNKMLVKWLGIDERSWISNKEIV